MSLAIVGSIAIDSIQTPWGKVPQVLGGSATYAALAARLWTPVCLVGVVGTDFPAQFSRLFDRLGLAGPAFLKIPGRTFRWKGRYDSEGQATTLSLELGVFRHFHPRLPASFKRVRYAFLGNIQPALQWDVLQQLLRPRLTACDSRADWIQGERRGFLKVLKAVDLVFLNDSEARILTGVHSLVEAAKVLPRLGPKVAIVKKGEHGALAASRDAFFSLPGYPVAKVVDPTGAGDAFAGACLGFLSNQRRVTWASLCRAVAIASSAASMTIEAFGPRGLLRARKLDVLKRERSFQNLAKAVIL